MSGLRWRTRVRVAAEVLRALGVMLLVELSLRTADLPTTCRRLRLECDLHSSAPPAERVAVLPHGARAPVLAIGIVLARWPFGDTCLRRCLVLGHRLRRLGPVLRIGVRREPTGAFAAHSWLELGGTTLDPTASQYAVLGARWTG